MDAIDHLLTRGVDSIYPNREALEKVLRSGRKLRLYQGFDPTGPQLHIGHAVALRKLREFQKLGHHVIFLIGDFTGMIGDPTGKLSDRKILTKETVSENARTYKEQASRILKFDGDNPVEILHNSDWLGKMPAFEFLRIANLLSVQQVVERDMFQERIKKDQDIFMNEFLYPVLQAYDSVAMNVDLEIGGSDQMFNMMMGRKLMRHMLKKEKFVMTVPLLTDANGVKIGKTEGNVIGLTDAPNEFYGKIMSLGDDAIIPCFRLLSDASDLEINAMKKSVLAGENPMNFKKKLAFELTKQFNSEKEAAVAQEEFETRFQKGQISEAALPTMSMNSMKTNSSIVESLVSLGLVSSKSDAKRLIEQKAVKVNGGVVATFKDAAKLKPGDTVEVGRKAVKIVS